MHLVGGELNSKEVLWVLRIFLLFPVKVAGENPWPLGLSDSPGYLIHEILANFELMSAGQLLYTALLVQLYWCIEKIGNSDHPAQRTDKNCSKLKKS